MAATNRTAGLLALHGHLATYCPQYGGTAAHSALIGIGEVKQLKWSHVQGLWEGPGIFLLNKVNVRACRNHLEAGGSELSNRSWAGLWYSQKQTSGEMDGFPEDQYEHHPARDPRFLKKVKADPADFHPVAASPLTYNPEALDLLLKPLLKELSQLMY